MGLVNITLQLFGICLFIFTKKATVIVNTFSKLGEE